MVIIEIGGVLIVLWKMSTISRPGTIFRMITILITVFQAITVKNMVMNISGYIYRVCLAKVNFERIVVFVRM